MDTRRTRTCDKCKTQIPVDQVKLWPKDKDKTWIVCSSCLEALKKSSQVRAGNMPPSKQEAVRNLPRSAPPTVPPRGMPQRPLPVVGKDKEAIRNMPKPRDMGFSPDPLPKDPIRNVTKNRLSEESPKATPHPILSRSVAPAVKAAVKAPVAKTEEEMIFEPSYKTMHCTRCNYTFKVDQDKVGIYYKLHCPFCGKTDRLTGAKKK